jgi:methionine synthase II (cobalamin-independent)
VFAQDARFLRANTERVVKFALPSPFLVAVRCGHEDHSRNAYPTMTHFLDHLAEILAREAEALVAEGIDIVQLCGSAHSGAGPNRSRSRLRFRSGRGGEPPTIDEGYEKSCRLVAAARLLRTS